MSHKQKYPSHLGATRKITAPNFLTEFILLRHADNRGIKLPDRIWNPKFADNLQWKYWHSLYIGELSRVSNLLQEFDINDILAALKDGPGNVILSFSNPKLKPLIVQAQQKRQLAEKMQEKVELTLQEVTAKPRQQYGKKSKLGKLR